MFRPKAANQGGFSNAPQTEAPTFKRGGNLSDSAEPASGSYVPTSQGRPSRVELNTTGISAVAKAAGADSFEGVHVTVDRARELAQKLEDSEPELASVIHRAAAWADPLSGVSFYEAGNVKAESEETIHSGQMRAGKGEFQDGVPQEMETHPAFQAMANRIKGEVGESRFTPTVHVAEGYNDLVNDEAPEVKDVSGALEDHYRAVIEKVGADGLRVGYAEPLSALRDIYQASGIEIPEGVRYAEQAINRVQSEHSQGQGDIQGDQSGDGSGRQKTVRPEDKGTERPSGQNSSGEDLARPMGQGTAGNEMDGWLRGAKSLTVEPAGEQVGLFGDAEPMHRIVRTDSDGNIERHLVTESQLTQLQKQPAYKRAAAQGQQRGMFGSDQGGELIGNGNRGGGMSLPPQKSSNQDTLFRKKSNLPAFLRRK